VNTRAYKRVIEFAALVGLLASVGCAGVKPIASSGNGGSSATGASVGTSTGGSTGAGGTVVAPTGCNGQCTDFEPTASNPNPIFQVNVPTDVAGMFGTPSGSGPCVTEPEDGSLFPNNWLSPRVHVPGNTGYLKITFHAAMESTDLVAYAQGDSWALPKPIWQALAVHIVQQDVTVTVQTPGCGATSVNFQIAPVGAGGSMVFWSMDPAAVGKDLTSITDVTTIKSDSFLDGFTVGDSTTLWQSTQQAALWITDVQQQVPTQGGNTQASHCIGCHVGTPDGNYVGFVDAWPWGAAFANIQSGTQGQTLTTLSGASYAGATCTSWNNCTGSRTFVQYPWMGGMAFSKSHWASGDQIAVVAAQIPASDLDSPWNTDDYQPGNLVWVDTDSSAITVNNGAPFPTRGTAFDYMQHTGDLGGVAFPTWSNDGSTIVYSSTPGGCSGQGCTPGDQDGRLNVGQTDLYSVLYNNKAGGAAMPVPGGSSSSLEEYYAAFSPDDATLAFTAVPAGQVMYANEQAELYMVPFSTTTSNSGAQAVRLNANDPPKCTGLQSPGINNHWPKWSPTVGTDSSGNSYYWLIFSSNRYNPQAMTVTNGSMTNTVYVSQLYITAVVKTELGYQTYPSIYLYNQPSNRLNTTPAWQDFNIPIIIDRP
jgi:WD40-like Beta Propeller Repeat